MFSDGKSCFPFLSNSISEIYEDDIEKIDSYRQKYLNGEIEKYSIEFRLEY